jgi:glycosyltransferase involved in cell wall biosynthesis
VAHCRLDDSFPEPSLTAREQARAVLAAIPDGATVVIDGLACGVLPELVECERERLRLVALVHHPLAAESGLAPGRAAALHGSESRALAATRRVLTTSRATARLLADYGVPTRRIRIVVPGTDPAPAAHGSPDGVPRLLCVAALVPRKGHDLLLRALAGLADRPWHLTCVGTAERDSAWARGLADLRDRLGLAGRVGFAGVLEEAALGRCYAESDLFVLATRFEGYGMAFAEALARGLPILATRVGAVPETVPSGAGLLVPAEDPLALSAALCGLLDDAGLRRRLGAGARAAGRRLPAWTESAAAFSAACREIDDG